MTLCIICDKEIFNNDGDKTICGDCIDRFGDTAETCSGFGTILEDFNNFEKQEREFSELIDYFAVKIHNWATEKGFWDARSLIGSRLTGDIKKRFTHSLQAEKLALIHSEISEALEYLRHDNPPDDKIPEFDGVTVELADAIIRILDYAGAYNLPLGNALLRKLEFNNTRPKKHGKEF